MLPCLQPQVLRVIGMKTNDIRTVKRLPDLLKARMVHIGHTNEDEDVF